MRTQIGIAICFAAMLPVFGKGRGEASADDASPRVADSASPAVSETREAAEPSPADSSPAGSSSFSPSSLAEAATGDSPPAVRDERRTPLPSPLGTTGIVLVGAGAAPFLVLLPHGVNCGWLNRNGSSGGPVCRNLGTAMMVSAAVIGVGVTLVATDLVLRDKEKRNVEVSAMDGRDRSGTRLSLAPALFPVDDGHVAPGLAFTASFR